MLLELSQFPPLSPFTQAPQAPSGPTIVRVDGLWVYVLWPLPSLSDESPPPLKSK